MRRRSPPHRDPFPRHQPSPINRTCRCFRGPISSKIIFPHGKPPPINPSLNSTFCWSGDYVGRLNSWEGVMVPDHRQRASVVGSIVPSYGSLRRIRDHLRIRFENNQFIIIIPHFFPAARHDLVWLKDHPNTTACDAGKKYCVGSIIYYLFHGSQSPVVFSIKKQFRFENIRN